MVQQFKPLNTVSSARRFRGTLGWLALATLAVACTPPAKYEPGPIGDIPAGSFRRTWLADLSVNQGQMKSIDVRDKAIYVYGTAKHASSINREAGTVNFVSQVPSPSSRILPPVELSDKIVFPTATSLELFDYKGNPLRSVPLSSPLRSGAVGAGNFIYFGADGLNGGLIESIDLTRDYSTSRWELLTPGTSVTATPCLYSSILYVGTEAGEVYAVNELRNPVWNTDDRLFHCTGAIVADLKADDAGLYVASQGGILYCINRTTGKLKWQYFAGAPLAVAPVPTTDTIYQSVPNTGLAAVDKNEGGFNRNPRWVFPNATQFLAQDDRYAYLVEEITAKKKTTRTIVAVDKKTGQRAFQSKRSNFNVFGTNNKDNTIYVGYQTGALLALKPVLKAGTIGELVLTPVNPADAVTVASAMQ